MESDREIGFGDAIFDPAFGLDGPHLVAASAGTGKTHNIQNIYVRLVAEKGFRVSQIQVMTFTEAATKELRERVRSVLSNMARLYAGDIAGLGESELDRLRKLRGCARDDAAARTRIELALAEFDQAAISTIHGFCRRALVRFAFETGSAFRSEFADTKSEDLSRRVRDWWRRERQTLTGPAKDGLELGMLDRFVQALSGKSGWIVDEGAADDPGQIALERAKEIVDAYEEDRSMRETQTFDDLLRGLKEALENNAALAASLREEFKAALVDEFQDTDPVQYDIFRRVFLDPEVRPAPAIFFVGDPKQAIYSFRGGDIYTYKRAVTDPAVAANTFRLDRNFRSTPRLVDAVNALFMDWRRPDGSCDCTFGDRTIGYSCELLSDAGKEAFKLPGGGDDPSPFRIVEVEKSSAHLQAVVDTVLDILEEQRDGGLSPKDIAILVSRHADGDACRDMLREAGVPAVLQKAGNVFAGELAADFRQVLMAMAQMGGRGQLKAALLTRFFPSGESLFADEDKLADMTGFFGDLGRMWRRKGFDVALAALGARPECDFRRNLAKLPGGERLLADLMQIVDLADSAMREIGPSPEALVNWITDRINRSGEGEKDSEEYARQLESESDALKIMTIHVSKGLQFPVAIVPLSGGKDAKAPYFYHDGNMDLRVGMSDEAEAQAQAECDAERMRLLYVAFTRATKRTVVVAQPPDSGSPLGRLFANARRRGAGENDATSPIAWSKYVPPQTPPPPYVPPAKEPAQLDEAHVPREYSMRRSKGSFSSLAPAAHGAGDGEHDFDGPEPDAAGTPSGIFSLPGGVRTGMCWHKILERLPFDAGSKAVLDETERSLKLYGFGEAGGEKFAENAKLVADMVAATLDYPLRSPDGGRFALRDVSMADRFSEWEFDFSSSAAADTTAAISEILREEWGADASKRVFLDMLDGWNRPVPKGFLAGFLDLVFRRDGFYYVVDWKSNRLNADASGFTKEGVAAEMAKKWYFLQYLIYSVALHRFLKETMRGNYSWARNFGGVRYCFLRGIAAGGVAPVYEDRPGEALLDRLSAALGLEG
ncbi:MAG: UvrD-helicase domain-containing protein [Kiritimatiellae bacterium]|nr:UvrD-helicase domain-containing protein [Kiritimatiellia bacterium]